MFYVIVPPNCTDRLQPLAVSVNKAAKEFLRSQFQAWYAEKVASQVQRGKTFTPVDLKLSIVKPVGAKWMIKLYDHFKSMQEFHTFLSCSSLLAVNYHYNKCCHNNDCVSGKRLSLS